MRNVCVHTVITVFWLQTSILANVRLCWKLFWNFRGDLCEISEVLFSRETSDKQDLISLLSSRNQLIYQRDLKGDICFFSQCGFLKSKSVHALKKNHSDIAIRTNNYKESVTHWIKTWFLKYKNWSRIFM